MKAFNAVVRMLLVGVLMGFTGSLAAQQAYPNRPIRFIVPYPPGASNDYVVRLVAPKLAESLGQAVIVDNRPGGNTVIGSEALVKSPPDGHTIMLTSIAHVFNALSHTGPYDAIEDFAPICTATNNRLVLVINPSVPANNLQELIALAKATPGRLNHGAINTGGITHLAMELVNMSAGIKVQHIPYKGGAPALADLIGGHVQLAFQSPVTAMPHIKSGKLRAIAISGETRPSALPQVPTFTEAGLPGINVDWWHGIFAPAGTSKAIIDKLSVEIGRIVIMPDIREKLASQVMEPLITTPSQFAALIRSDMAKFARIIKDANIKLN
ncbi:MAG: tripartite tricarboxylate transporter substrate binding protein [Pseudomonadota bacterium]